MKYMCETQHAENWFKSFKSSTTICTYHEWKKIKNHLSESPNVATNLDPLQVSIDK